MTPNQAKKLRRLVQAPVSKPHLLPVSRPNAGIQMWYQKQLMSVVKDMQKSIEFWVVASYRQAGFAEGLATDASGTSMLEAAMKRLSKRWQNTFNKLADKLSKQLADRVLTVQDNGLISGLKAEGLSVKFTMTERMNDAYQAVINEQVGLIRSIASEHLSDVSGMVMRSVQRGRDLGQLTSELKARYNVTQRRAALIARDQNNKATSTIQATRQLELGVTQGVWRHSHAGKTPRQSHLDANGTVFDLKKGLYLNGKWVMPGEEINCRCGWQPVIPGLES